MNLSRKLKIESLERCLNCKRFEDCEEERKEDIECCEDFEELEGEVWSIECTKL